MEVQASLLIMLVLGFIVVCLFLGLRAARLRLRCPWPVFPLLIFVIWWGSLFIIPEPWSFASSLLFCFWIAFSNAGLALVKGLTYSELILFHSFRIFLAMALVVGAAEGLLPGSLTMQGGNFDIVVGLSALVLAPYIKLIPNLRWVRAWNFLGLFFLLLSFILGTATGWPQDEWLRLWPGLLLGVGLCGHLLIWRKLRLDPRA